MSVLHLINEIIIMKNILIIFMIFAFKKIVKNKFLFFSLIFIKIFIKNLSNIYLIKIKYIINKTQNGFIFYKTNTEFVSFLFIL